MILSRRLTGLLIRTMAERMDSTPRPVPGPAIPSLQSLKKMLPADHQWPQDAVWGYHAGGEGFQNIHVFNDAMIATYGEAKTRRDITRSRSRWPSTESAPCSKPMAATSTPRLA